MELVFTCPKRQAPFFSADYEVSEYGGIGSDGEGRRVLRARVRLTSPCPHCGGVHEYDANELACPIAERKTAGEG